VTLYSAIEVTVAV